MGRHRTYDHSLIFSMYKQGYSPAEIGERTGANADYVGTLIRKAGVQRKPGRPRRVETCQDCGSHNVRSEIVG